MRFFASVSLFFENRHMNNTLIKVTVILILLSTALTSLYLTARFTYDLGVQSGSGWVFLVIGVTLDITKTVCPALSAILISQQKYLLGIFAGFVALALIGVSTAASISAIESSVVAARKGAKENTVIQKQIEMLESEVSELNLQIAAMVKKNYITKSNQLRPVLAEKQKQLSELLERSLTVSSEETLFTRYGNQISIGLSVLLEVISVFMSLALSNMRSTQTIQNKTEIVLNPVNTPNTENGSNTSIIAHRDDLTTVKRHILSGSLKPSHRSIRSQYKLSQHQITELLNDLFSKGHLEKSGSGFKLI